MTLNKWSQTAATNADVDSTINWREGQAPSTANNSARAMMAAVAKFRDDLAGNTETAGTSTAYTLTTNQVFAALADGLTIGFVPDATNGASATLNVDGLGAKPLRTRTATAIAAGVLIAGTPYRATYNLSADEWRVHGLGAAADFMVPLGAFLPYAGTTAPSSNYVLPYGQAISRTTYADLFALLSTTYGVGDGSTTFNVPDLRGRVIAGQDDMGGSSANRLTGLSGGLNGDTLGAVGGAETHTLATTELASHTHGVSGNTGGQSNTHTHSYTDKYVQNSGTGTTGGGSISDNQASDSSTTGNASADHTHAISLTSAAAGGGGAHNNVQPTIILNYIMRVL
jgi:microcystin-dependent protein